MTNPNIYISYDSRNAKEGMYYIKWCLVIDSKTQLIATGSSISESEVEFLKSNKDSLSGQIKDANKIFLWNFVYGKSYIDPVSKQEKKGLLEIAKAIIDKLGDKFSVDSFKTMLVQYNKNPKTFSFIIDSGNSNMTNDVLYELDCKFRLFHEREQFGQGALYRDARSSLIRFRGDSLLKFHDINEVFLSKYETWMLKEGKTSKRKDIKKGSPASPTTIGMYLRNVRSLFNDAIDAGVIKRELYPFSSKRYKIPAASKVKKAKAFEDIERLIEYEPENEFEARSRDFWIFSYLCNGINFSDILRLKWSDLGEDGFSFVRKKTRRTKKENQKKISVYVDDLARDIINRWGSKIQVKHSFVFPFLNENMSEYEKHKTTKAFIKITNTHMDKIGKSIGIDGDMSTYSARHTFGTMLLRSGHPLLMVSEMLGHSTTAMTQQYFGGYTESQIKDAMGALTKKAI